MHLLENSQDLKGTFAKLIDASDFDSEYK